MRATPRADLTVYALPDGSIPIICRGGRTDPSGKTERLPKICDACRLTAAPGLTSTPTLLSAFLPFATVAVVYWRDERLGATGDFPYDGQSRGPPTAFLA
jgi:hypothetical protein